MNPSSSLRVSRQGNPSRRPIRCRPHVGDYGGSVRQARSVLRDVYRPVMLAPPPSAPVGLPRAAGRSASAVSLPSTRGRYVSQDEVRYGQACLGFAQVGRKKSPQKRGRRLRLWDLAEESPGESDFRLRKLSYMVRQRVGKITALGIAPHLERVASRSCCHSTG